MLCEQERARFMKKMAQVQADQTFVSYRIKNVEVKEISRKIIDRIASGQKQSKDWAAIRQAFDVWFRFGYDGAGDVLDRKVRRQMKIDRGELQVYDDGMRSVLIDDRSDEDEDA
ncbi:hypothetical protein LTR36_002463 [Oleoguttula mirabilis]|uniref:Uncharacterized protein n=1 Tax=Oleoguttula mirabilis TaxID=1507867 RepID=A0AAV9JKA0_9PEZI|nr:hypothetical protein LTR36_002463 [Oleoguttula mirabilis]